MTSMPPPPPVRADAEAFLRALTGSAEAPVTFQTFDDNKERKDPQLARHRHGTLAQLWPWLVAMNAKGAGIFVMVNEGDGRGRSTSNVVGLRALFVDDDSGALTPQALELTPSIIVQSAHGIHAYWRLRIGEELSDFESAQSALATHLDTDRKVKDLPRVMRVPGFLNLKNPASPFLVQVVQSSDAAYSISEVLEGVGARIEQPTSLMTTQASAPRSAASVHRNSNVGRARRWMEKRAPAIEGNGGDAHTFATAAALVVDFDLSDDQALELLRDWNRECSPPWSDEELSDKLLNARKYGSHPPGTKLRALPSPPAASGAPDERADASGSRSSSAPLAEPSNIDPTCSQLRCNDIGNGQRLLARHGAELRFCHPWKKWLVYDGTRWRVDDTGAASALAKKTAVGIYGEVAAATDPIQLGLLQSHAPKSCSAKSVAAMLTMAASEPAIAVRPTELDRDAWVLNLLNGTLDLHTGSLRPHDRRDLLTKLAPVRFDVAAICPTWLAFLDRIMEGDAALIRFLQRAVGYSLTGDVGADAFFFLFGGGANGKGVFLNTLTAMLGDYAAVIPTELLLEARGERHSTDKTLLHGVRLAVCQELKEGRRFDMGTVKTLTGRDPITARRMREDNWTFLPTHKLWLAANNQPRVPENDEATWRRILLHPFAVTIPEAERDPTLSAKCLAEAPGILNWAVQGLREWLAGGSGRKGLGPPERVNSATAAYREQEDMIGAFIAARCVLAPTAAIGKGDLYTEYDRWCAAEREPALSKRDFIIRIELLDGVLQGKVQGNRGWRGLGLRGAPMQTDLREAPRA